jgi:hypothetical protein
MVPSFLCFGVAWLFLACNEQTRKNPSPWHKRRRYGPFFGALTVQSGSSETIAPNQNLEEYRAYIKTEEERKARLKKGKEDEAKHEQEIASELGEEIGDANAQDVDISTKKGGLLQNITVNPLKPVLHPIQLQLKDFVFALRIATGILLWEETYYAFWIVTLSFVASVATIWIPWALLLRWCLRISAWIFLGPWTAIFIRLYFRQNPDMTDKEKQSMVRERKKSKYSEVQEAASNFYIRRERAVKLAAFKKYFFGKFLVNVPRFGVDLYSDTPRPESSATPFDHRHAEPIVVRDRKYGQSLVGDMIPKRDIQAAESKKAKHPTHSKSRLKFWKSSRSKSENTPLLSRFEEMSGQKDYSAVEESSGIS